MRTQPVPARRRFARRGLGRGYPRAAAALGVRLVGFGIAAAALGLGGVASAQDKPATMPATAPAQSGTGAAVADDGPAYPVSQLVFSYAQAKEKLPPLEQLGQVLVELGRAADGSLVAWRPGQGFTKTQFTIAQANAAGVQNYHQSALLAIDGAIVRYFNDKKGLIGIYVAQSGNDIDPTGGDDLRKKGDTDLHLVIWVGVVKEMRTVAAGDRFKIGERINNPAHRKVLENSPVKPEGQGGTDLLKRDAIDEYVFRLNRDPSRKVDVAMAAAKDQGGVALDYLISESKPWSIYAQLSNTGTRQTSDWRERFGALHNNLTGHGDILSLDFITAGFETGDQESNAALGSYEAPLFGLQTLRGRAYVSWNKFTASDLGAADQHFNGEESVFGGELIANIYQKRELFVDAVGGVRYKHVSNFNSGVGERGEADFWIPYVGLRLDRSTEQTSLRASVTALFGTTSSKQTSSGSNQTDSLDGLGRLTVDDDWEVIQAEVSESFYLEPLLLPQSKLKSLANEIVLSARGSYSFNNRLVPQEQEVLGGLYTVRGYPESLVAGDNIWVVSAEYRFHLPRALPVRSDPENTPLFGKPFRYRPSEPLGRTDWDLVLKAFIDAGQVTQSGSDPTEQQDTLIGAGVGFDLSFKQNMILRVDYGVALRDAGTEDNGVNAGHSRVHVVFTILY
jgi:hemolysin activation/secretion protein